MNACKVLASYALIYIDAPKYPKVKQFIYTNRKAIYINLAAEPDAKIINVVFS